MSTSDTQWPSVGRLGNALVHLAQCQSAKHVHAAEAKALRSLRRLVASSATASRNSGNDVQVVKEDADTRKHIGRYDKSLTSCLYVIACSVGTQRLHRRQHPAGLLGSGSDVDEQSGLFLAGLLVPVLRAIGHAKRNINGVLHIARLLCRLDPSAFWRKCALLLRATRARARVVDDHENDDDDHHDGDNHHDDDDATIVHGVSKTIAFFAKVASRIVDNKDFEYSTLWQRTVAQCAACCNGTAARSCSGDRNSAVELAAIPLQHVAELVTVGVPQSEQHEPSVQVAPHIVAAAIAITELMMHHLCFVHTTRRGDNENVATVRCLRRLESFTCSLVTADDNSSALTLWHSIADKLMSGLQLIYRDWALSQVKRPRLALEVAALSGAVFSNFKTVVSDATALLIKGASTPAGNNVSSPRDVDEANLRTSVLTRRRALWHAWECFRDLALPSSVSVARTTEAANADLHQVHDMDFVLESLRVAAEESNDEATDVLLRRACLLACHDACAPQIQTFDSAASVLSLLSTLAKVLPRTNQRSKVLALALAKFALVSADGHNADVLPVVASWLRAVATSRDGTFNESLSAHVLMHVFQAVQSLQTVQPAVLRDVLSVFIAEGRLAAVNLFLSVAKQHSDHFVSTLPDGGCVLEHISKEVLEAEYLATTADGAANRESARRLLLMHADATYCILQVGDCANIVSVCPVPSRCHCKII